MVGVVAEVLIMKAPLVRFGMASALALGLFGLVGCEDSKTTTAPGALASVRFSAPDSVKSGTTFTVDVNALNIGVNGVHNGRVDITLPSPLTVTFVDASPGTSATFSNGSGATVSWNLNTLDSNSGSSVHIQTMGMLLSGSPMSLTLRASMTADGIAPGDAVTTTTVVLMP